MRTLLLASALFAGLFGSSAAIPFPGPVPYHAFCRITWLFESPCAEIKAILVKQIQAFNPQAGCDKCSYVLVSAKNLSIVANHTSYDALKQNITLTLNPTILTSGCRVSAQSISIVFTSLLDKGLNYCNLYDLLSASGLISTPGFMELTNEWACLGYGLATCNN